MPGYQLIIASFILYMSGIYMAGRVSVRLGYLALLLILSSLFFSIHSLYIISYYFTGKGFDESVVYHLLYGVSGAGISDYWNIIVVISAFIVFGLSASFYAISRKHSTHQHAYRKSGGLIPVSLIIASIFINPPSAYYIGYLLVESKGDFYRYYRDPYIAKRAVEPRNIVYIYLEGLERTYFDESIFPGLIKKLRSLESKSTHFTNIKQVWGTGWTMAGTTSSQCGIPLVTPSHGNTMSGFDNFLEGAVCLGDLLHGEGYHLSYLDGSYLRFAGIGNFYSTHGFTDVHGRKVLSTFLEDENYLNAWGLYDDVLFENAFKKYTALSESGKPFGLFMLTNGTHHPFGNVSRGCGNLVYSRGKNPSLNAVACADYLAGNFIEKILASEYAENTIIVVSSDHLSFRNTAYKWLEKADKRRNLFMIIDPLELTPVEIDKPGTTMDISPVLLGKLGYEGSIGLGRNLLNGEVSLSESVKNIDETLKGWESTIMDMWEFPRINENVVIDESHMSVSIGSRVFKVPALIEFNGSMETVIKFQFNSSVKMTLRHIVLDTDMNTPFIWIDDCNVIRMVKDTDGLCAVVGKLGAETLGSYKINGSHEITQGDLRKAILMRVSEDSLKSNRFRMLYGNPL